MSSVIRLNRSNCEKALMAFFVDALGKSELNDMNIQCNVRMGEINKETGTYAFENPQEIDYSNPIVCIKCYKCQFESAPYPICDVMIVITGSIDVDNATSNHDKIVGFVTELFSDFNNDAIFAFFNTQTIITDFLLFGIYQTDEDSEISDQDRIFVDNLLYKVHCQPTANTG